MSKPLALLASGLLVALLIPGTADALAYPIRNAPALTDNGLYDSGKMKTSDCSDGALSTESTADAKRTLTALWSCMNTSWSAHFKRAKLPFTPAKLVVFTKPTRFCGEKWAKNSYADYCPATKTAALLADEDYYLRTRVIFHFQYAAGLYGNHLQYITGIARAYHAPNKSKAEGFEKDRRWSLQAGCLGSVFLGSIWETAGQDSEGWPALMKLVKANGDGWARKYDSASKGKNLVYWNERGFKSGDPGSCNTWKAPSVRVA